MFVQNILIQVFWLRMKTSGIRDNNTVQTRIIYDLINWKKGHVKEKKLLVKVYKTYNL